MNTKQKFASKVKRIGNKRRLNIIFNEKQTVLDKKKFEKENRIGFMHNFPVLPFWFIVSPRRLKRQRFL